jgi:hypothetical protein
MKTASTKDRGLQYIRALVFGESGVGKTTSLGTLPQDRTVIAAAERGLLPLRSKDYHVVLIEGWDDVRTLIKTFMQPYDLAADSKTPRAATVLAVDSLSELSELCKRNILQDRRVMTKERTDGKADRPKGIYDDIMTREDWGLHKTRMRNMVSALNHLPVHTVVTCLSGWTEDQRSGGLHIAPDIGGGGFAAEVPAYFDLVLYMLSQKAEGGTSQRLWQTHNDGQVIAKDASGVLGQFEEPDWTRLFKKIIGKDKESK